MKMSSVCPHGLLKFGGYRIFEVGNNFPSFLVLSSNSNVILNIRFQSFGCVLFYSLQLLRPSLYHCGSKVA